MYIASTVPDILYRYQIHYAFRFSTEKVLVKEGIEYERYIRREVFELIEYIRVISIKPLGDQELKMIVLGLDFTMEDILSMSMLRNFSLA